MEDGYLVYLTREEYQVCSIQVRGDVIDFHLAVTRGYEPAIVSASGEWARKIIAMLESRPQPDIVVKEQP